MNDWIENEVKGAKQFMQQLIQANTALRAENEKLQAKLEGTLDCSKAYDAMAKLCSETEWTLKNEIEKLRAALKPFAVVANHIVTGTSDETICPDVEFTAGDLRAAAAALKETGDE